MAASSTKPAPLPLGVREKNGNVVDLLPPRNPMVDQLLEDFARGTRTVSPPPPPPKPAMAAGPDPAQLLKRIEQLETRVRLLEAQGNTRATKAETVNERVLTILEQLVAELRER